MKKKNKIAIICAIFFLSSLIFSGCSKQPKWQEPPAFDFGSLSHIQIPIDVPTMEIKEDGQTLEFKIIRTLEDLDDVRNDIEDDYRMLGNYILANDIDFMSLDEGKIFQTISGFFLGIFNGNNYRIMNITFVGYYQATPSALFDIVGDWRGGIGIVKNLIISGNIFSRHMSASVANWNYGIIDNCVNFANITADLISQGGIVNTNWESGIVSNCVNYGQIGGIKASNMQSGGIAVDNYGTIKNCTNYGTILGGRRTGGIAGFITDGYISDCINYGMIMSVVNTDNATGEAVNNDGIVGVYTSMTDVKTARKNTTNCKNYGSIIIINEEKKR